MKIYRLIIRNRERLLGHFESDTPWSEEATKEILACLSKHSDYHFELQIAYDEKRLVESTPQGVRVLSRELLFKPVPLDI